MRILIFYPPNKNFILKISITNPMMENRLDGDTGIKYKKISSVVKLFKEIRIVLQNVVLPPPGIHLTNTYPEKQELARFPTSSGPPFCRQWPPSVAFHMSRP